MLPTYRVIRLSDGPKGPGEKHLELAWTAILQARQTLTDHPSPDTFLGRKTQEPFPNEDVV